MAFSNDQIAAVLQGRRAVRIYQLPFAEQFSIGMRVLSEDEIDASRIAGAEYCKKRRVDLEVDPEFIDREIRRQVLWRACVDAGDFSRPFFPSDNDLRTLDSEMVRTLFETYLEHQRWVTPLRSAEAEGVKLMVEALGKAQSPHAVLASYDYDTLRHFALSLALLARST